MGDATRLRELEEQLQGHRLRHRDDERRIAAAGVVQASLERQLSVIRVRGHARASS